MLFWGVWFTEVGRVVIVGTAVVGLIGGKTWDISALVGDGAESIIGSSRLTLGKNVSRRS
jgi:hypothetical protein